MNKIKKGDIVGRISYGKDIIFIVERITYDENNNKVAMLKGLTARIQADSTVEDLELIETKKVEEHLRTLEECVEKHIMRKEKTIQNNTFREKMIIHTGKILHIDGDRRYSEKSNMYYRKLGMNAIVKNIAERKQPFVIRNLIARYNPEILIITGHDRNDKKGNQV